MNNFWFALISGVVSGFVVAIILFILKMWLRPTISISPFIVYWQRDKKDGETGEKEHIYQIKFHNKTYFNIENISVDIFHMTDYYRGSRKNYQAQPVKSFSNKFLKGKKDMNKELVDNCVVLTIKEKEDYDIIKKLNNNDWIHVQIIAYHSLSGFRRAITAKYTDISSCIKHNKKFESGEFFNTMDA